MCEKLYQKDDLKVMPIVVDSRTNRARYCDCLLKIEDHLPLGNRHCRHFFSSRSNVE